MTTTDLDTRPADHHLSDGDLVRRLDDELDPREAARVDAHLTGCERCHSAMTETRVHSLRVSRLLEIADPTHESAPATTEPASGAPAAHGGRLRWRSTYWHVAAAILLTAGLALGATGLRSWIGDASRAAWSLIADAADSGPGDSSVWEGGSLGSVTATFVPYGDRFAIRVTHRQASGTLRLRPGDGPSASARVEGGTGIETLLVVPDGVSILNDARSTADYEIVIPPSVTEVEIRIAAEGIHTAPAPHEGEPSMVFDLAR